MAADSISSGNVLHQRNYNILVPKFKLTFAITSGDYSYYNVIPVSNNNLRWDINNASDSDGSAVKFFNVNNAYRTAQEFRFIKNSDGTYYIMPRLSTTRVVSASSTGEKANIVLQRKTNSDNQKWIIKRDKIVHTYSGVNNTSYSPAKAGRYALRNGDTPNFVDYPDVGQNCTNFASQCLHEGGMTFKPESPSVLTNRSNLDNWFSVKAAGSSFWTAHAWSKATDFYTHMTTYPEVYRTINYQTGWDAFEDFDYICTNMTMGDMFQQANMEYVSHSMVIYNRDTCNGSHKGGTNNCPRNGQDDLFYAQNVYSSTASSNYTNGHVCYVIFNNFDSSYIFYDITSRF